MNNQIITTGKRGGARPNAGIKKGYKYQTTLEKQSVLKEIQQRTMRHADKLWNAQYAKAIGSIQVFRIDEIDIGGGKTKTVHTLVTDSDEIKAVLDATANGEATTGVYFVTEIPPDNKAIDSMLDRAFGKSVQQVEITDNSNSNEALANKLLQKALENGAKREEAIDYICGLMGIGKEVFSE